MNLEPGHTLLHYRLVDKLGEGGMGVVWRAVDTTLDREVAIKVLPAAFAADAERLARFEREAKVLASLSHPNIAGIYGFHTANETRFLAMELVQGEDLAERLARGPLAMDDAIAAARAIAEALEAAHEAGVIHRDLKPANVKRAADGTVKVLDFGLAKAMEATPASGSLDATSSPTVTSAGTLAGMILGTAAYMSPEQARGKPLDRRTDLWSFGCVLYELLGGKRAFPGETITDVLSAVISREPDWSALPATTPRALRRLLERCLTKDARDRIADASTARLELDAARRELAAPESVAAAAASPGRARLPWAIAFLALAAAFALWFVRPNAAFEAGTPRITGIEALTDTLGPEFMPTISPDGKSLVYAARHDGNDLDLFLVRVGGANPINLTANHDGNDYAPAFSPDGDRIAFASDREGGGLFVMGATGESPRRVANRGTHPDWSPDGTRLVAATEQVDDPYSRNTESAIFVVDLASGAAHDLPAEDAVGPRWSPDGKRIVYWTEVEGQRDILTLAVDRGASVSVTDDAHTDWEPLWAEGGRAIYFHSDRGGSADLWRIPIDPTTGAAAGEPTPLTIGVTPAWESSLSADGTRLVVAMRRRSGAVRAYPFDPEALRVTGPARTVVESNAQLIQPDLTRDGRRYAYRTTRPREAIVTIDLATGERRKLLDDGHRNRGPSWSPDGRWIAIYSNRGGKYGMWRVRAEGTDLHELGIDSANDPVYDTQGERLAIGLGADVDGARTSIFIEPDPDADDPRAPWVRVGETVVGFSPSAWSADGRRLLGSDGWPRQVRMLDVESGKIIGTSEATNLGDHDGGWLPDHRRALFWDDIRRTHVVWDVEADTLTAIEGLPAVPGTAIPSPDGRTLYVSEVNVDGEIWMLTLESTAER